ncbi:MAG: hypothetical protein WC985_08445 [Thermoplasmata archaeon]
MWTIANLEKLDHKLHHLRRVEASYRAAIRRAQQAMRENTADPVKAKKKFEKIRTKHERKIAKLQPKVKQLTNLRAERKG